MSSFFPSKKIVKKSLLKYLLLCVVVYCQVNCQADPHSLLKRLNTTIPASPEYDARKLNQIATLKQMSRKDHFEKSVEQKISDRSTIETLKTGDAEDQKKALPFFTI